MAIRWGILGCGDVCEVKAGPGFQKASGSELIAVMRRDREKAADFARRHKVPKWYNDADALIADPEVDAVYVASPPSSHVELALKVAKAKKPCLVEKPFARNAEECRVMVNAFREADTKLFVAFYRRALPVFVEAKRLLESGAIGTLTSVSHRLVLPAHRRENGWRVDPAISGAGLFLDLGSHAINALQFIVGPFENVVGNAGRVHPKSIVEEVVTLQWTNGIALGTGLWNFASDHNEDTIELIGTDGRLSWSCFGRGDLTLARGTSVQTTNHPNPPHVHQNLIQSIVDELSGKGVCPSDAISGMRTSEIMDVALAGFRAAASRE
jgi:predicted dehydrogenase